MLSTARPFAGGLQGRKLGEEACLRGDSGLQGCWGRMGVRPRGHRGEAGPVAEVLLGDQGWEGLHLGRATPWASGIRLHPSLPAPLPIFPHSCFSSYFTLYLSFSSFLYLGLFLLFSHFLFPSFPMYTLIDFFFSLTFLLSFLVFC